MRPYRLHVLFEHGPDGIPYSHSHIRLLRPLTHPSLRPWVRMSAGQELCEDHADVVVVDRLWRPDVSLEVASVLVGDIRRRGARLFYSLDDNLIALQSERKDFHLTQGRLDALNVFLRSADQVIVSTEVLKSAVQEFNPHVVVIPNYLDERLLTPARSALAQDYRTWISAWRQRSIQATSLTIGYMGTLTHDDDLHLIVPALRSVCKRYEGQIRVEIVGVTTRIESWSHFHGLPFYECKPGPVYAEYPAFLPWFCASCRWDIALAPLADTAFNRYKSDIKFLDYAAIGAAGIFSRAPAYASSVQHGVTGWLVENTADAWEDALVHLITHPAQAQVIAYTSQRYLYENRTLAQGARLWLAALDSSMVEGE